MEAPEFGLQQPRPAAVTSATAAPQTPTPAAAGDHGDCGAYSVSILRQGAAASIQRAGGIRALPAVP